VNNLKQTRLHADESWGSDGKNKSTPGNPVPFYEMCTKGSVNHGESMKGGQLMEIKSYTEQEKRALAEISIGIYGKELTLIMLPELKEYLNGSTKRDAFAEMIQHDQAKL
jgi:hypothetical protein